MTTDTRDPVAALRAEIAADTFSARWREGAGWTLDRLAEQGYVLVNVEGLAAALRTTRITGSLDSLRHDRDAAAILAAIQEQQS